MKHIDIFKIIEDWIHESPDQFPSFPKRFSKVDIKLAKGEIRDIGLFSFLFQDKRFKSIEFSISEREITACINGDENQTFNWDLNTMNGVHWTWLEV